MKLLKDSLSIHYEIHGEGQPLVILNGIMMSTLSWHQFLDDLNYQVILIDFIDQGQSSDGSHYNHDDQVAVVKHVVDHLKLQEINILGISYGAQIALQYAIEYHVDQLMICNAALYTTPWLSDIGKAWSLAGEKGDPELFFHVTIPYIYSHNFYNRSYDWMTERKQLLLEAFTPAFLNRMVRLIESSEGYDIRTKVQKISAKCLVVSSEFDYLTPSDETIQIHRQINGSEYVHLEACGHASMYEKPEAFIGLINGHFVS